MQSTVNEILDTAMRICRPEMGHLRRTLDSLSDDYRFQFVREGFSAWSAKLEQEAFLGHGCS